MSETPSPPEGRTASSRSPRAPLAAGTKRRILIVDDNQDVVSVIRRILSSQGYDTLAAGDGKEALELARRERPDLILLDWMLPEVDGLEVCKELKGDPETRGIMIVLVTGRGSVANRIEGFDAGADDYIPKPFNHPELLARIRSALRLKELTDNLEERNRQLLESQHELVRSEKMATIGLLASGIAHEFNNIMAGISGYAQLARSNPKFLPQLVEVALTQSERARELTRSLATYHRSEDEKSRSDISIVITSALCLVKKSLEDKSIQLEQRVEDDLPPAAIKPGQLQEVILNLVINAIHAIEGQGSIRLEAGRTGKPDRLFVRVVDDGRGIAPENLHRIFDPFFTTKGAFGGGKEEGTGLGLSVCYNIVQARGGRLSVESEPGKGSTFTIELPVSEEEEAPRESDARRTERSAKDRASTPLRILIVDDEGHIRSMIAEFLEEHQVVCCGNGQDAVAEYAQKPFDYVILDICMRDSITGFETLEKIIEIDPAAKVILASGRLPEQIDESILEKAHGHLLKPYKLDELAALLSEPERTVRA